MKTIKNILINWLTPDYNQLKEDNETLLKDIRTIVMSEDKRESDIAKTIYRMRFITENAIWFGETEKQSKINVYTFNYFWVKFHHLNPRLKLYKSSSRKLWERCNCSGKKKAIIEGLTKGIKVNAKEYLKSEL